MTINRNLSILAGGVSNTGVLGVPNGGTGLTSLTSGYIPYGNGTGAFSSSSTLTFNGGTLYAPNLQGPAFRVYLSANQSVGTNTWTTIALDTKDFDTASAFNTSNYQFKPAIAGYYQINGTVLFGASLTARAGTFYACQIYKNGSSYSLGQFTVTGTYGGTFIDDVSVTTSGLVYLNGSTDYVSLSFYNKGSAATNVDSGISGSFFSGVFVRSA